MAMDNNDSDAWQLLTPTKVANACYRLDITLPLSLHCPILLVLSLCPFGHCFLPLSIVLFHCPLSLPIVHCPFVFTLPLSHCPIVLTLHCPYSIYTVDSLSPAPQLESSNLPVSIWDVCPPSVSLYALTSGCVFSTFCGLMP